MTAGGKWALALVAVVVIVVAFVVLRGSDDPSGNGAATTQAGTAAATTTGTKARTTPARPAAPPVATIRVVDGKPAGGVERITRSKGERVRLRVISDTADEIHVHGYDLGKDVTAGGTVRFSFPATIDGRFVIELESSGTQLAELDVEP